MQDRLARFRVSDPRVIGTLIVLALSPMAKASGLYGLQNLGVDVITGHERYDGKQNFLEYTQVGPENRTVYFGAYQIPIHLRNAGVELRPDQAEPIKKRVAQILIR